MTVQPGESRLRLAWYIFAALLAVFTYFYGLDSDHIPKNGDEYPYEHITRLTADSGKLLPLQSQLIGQRNTKPPLLFWQGIASTNWGQDWTLWHLRYPSVIYTLLTGLMVFLLGWKLSRQPETGFLGLLAFLAFFNTYRYGRPFLTNPPEVFWLFLPFFVLLYWRPAAFESRFTVPVLIGISIGLGLLYKSFALLAPVGLALSLWYLHCRNYRLAEFLVKDAAKVIIASTVSLALFGLWFALDPDPLAVWKEFVVGENIGKFDPQNTSYLGKMLWGTSSIWSLALALISNAGLLAFPVAALFYLAFKRRRQMEDREKLLWLWVITLFVVFALPSQRSSRYLLASMPAIAVLCALNWHRISRKAFVVSLAVALGVIAVLAYFSVRLQHELGNDRLYPAAYWLLLAGTAALALLALFRAELTRPLVSVAVILVLLSLAAFMRPFDGAPGNYDAAAQQQARGKDVWTPCNFRAKDEGYRFILPGSKAHGYRDDQGLAVAQLAGRYPLFAVQVPLANPALHDIACTGCKIVGQRLDMRSRQSTAEMKEMFLHGKVFVYLFVREYLIEAPETGQKIAPIPANEGCR
ncbi:MAG: phospholipid carrier-dependent glycosyltransferase [Nitrosomonadales bacterium]|nr:phospholipid carrier-dependent glycosyltransferase [Nitrosomonadales bacterium]